MGVVVPRVLSRERLPERTMVIRGIPQRGEISVGLASARIRGGSSAGQSSGLIIRRSWVRAPPAPPELHKRSKVIHC